MNKASVEMTNFSATQILRENNYLCAYYCCKNGHDILTILEVLNFDLRKFEQELRCRNSPTSKFSHHLGPQIWQIDFT